MQPRQMSWWEFRDKYPVAARRFVELVERPGSCVFYLDGTLVARSIERPGDSWTWDEERETWEH